jgi:hypothetical protein
MSQQDHSLYDVPCSFDADTDHTQLSGESPIQAGGMQRVAEKGSVPRLAYIPGQWRKLADEDSMVERRGSLGRRRSSQKRDP